MTFEADRSPEAVRTVAACAQVVRILLEQGWELPETSVRVQGNRFDATTAAGIALASESLPADSAFRLARRLLTDSLWRVMDQTTADALSSAVAAHLTPPEAATRIAWEQDWLSTLAYGDVERTVLPELLWRAGGGRAIHDAVVEGWPEGALAGLRRLGVEDVTAAAAEMATAGLVNPGALGFGVRSPMQMLSWSAQSGDQVRFIRPGLRVLELPHSDVAMAVEVVHCSKAAAWLAVSYTGSRGFDALPLTTGTEVATPALGVRWAGIIAVSVEGGGEESFAFRPRPNFPARLGESSFVAAAGEVSLSWETESHEELQAFVVETVRRNAEGRREVLRRALIPVAEDGTEPFTYAYVDDDLEGVTEYRLLALSNAGLLAEMGVFPLLQE